MKKVYSLLFVLLLILVAIGALNFSIQGQKNQQTAAVNSTNSAQGTTVAIESVARPSNLLAAIFSSGTRSINWQTNNYPANVGVNINLLRKVSDTPVVYTLVRKIAVNTPNDGSEMWTPEKDETTNDLYIEVTCANSAQLNSTCQVASSPIKAF